MLNPQEIFTVNSLRQTSVSRKMNTHILLFDYYSWSAMKISSLQGFKSYQSSTLKAFILQFRSKTLNILASSPTSVSPQHLQTHFHHPLGCFRQMVVSTNLCKSASKPSDHYSGSSKTTSGAVTEKIYVLSVRKF